jgi:hypothetical protein
MSGQRLEIAYLCFSGEAVAGMVAAEITKENWMKPAWLHQENG